MIEQRRMSARFGFVLCALLLLPLLTECGSAGDSPATSVAGASGVAGQGGASFIGGGSGGSAETGAAGTPEMGGAAGAPAVGGAAGEPTAGSPATDAGAGGALAAAAGAGGASANCNVELTDYSSPSAAHVSLCSVIDYPMNPPVYGDHYPVWAAYRSYSMPIPLGFLVHNLEHGAVVLLYNCADGCASEVAEAQAFIDALPADPRCTEAVKHQVILSPDPTLPTRWGAIAWGHSLAAECFGAPALRTFYEQNVAHGGEDICADGEDLSAGACQ